MGVPKSKVSPSRKRMKHLQHVPEPVSWYKCLRCGEPKRPHRICTAHMEICALSDEDYETHKQKSGRSSSSSSDNA
jgi:ribosomal protein L32